MSPASVTLASALQIRGEALSEEELWSLLFLAAEQLLEDLQDDSSDYVVCPWSALLSVAGSLSFQDHISHVEAAPFKAPELLQGQNNDEPPDVSQMHVYSLGMTVYWSAGFHVPPNQPLQLCEPLHSILLTMCEDQPCKRLSLQSVLEACQIHQQEVTIYPAPATLHIRRLVGLVLGTITEVERSIVDENTPVQQQGRSYLLRKRLQQAVTRWSSHPRISERITKIQSSMEPHSSTLVHSHCSPFVNSTLPTEVPEELQESRQFSSGSAFSVAAENSRAAIPLEKGLRQRKEKFSRPEFIRLAREAPVTLHLPGSILTKKGKCYLALRDLRVVLLSGQCLEVKCDIESTAGAIFNTIMSFANLGELTYFGLAYLKDDSWKADSEEFFFLDNETRLCTVAPEGWSKHSQRKTSASDFTLFLRIKFFISHFGLLQQKQTRHQFYLQLRRDILEEKLYCNDETLLRLGVLALQAEFGHYPQEVKEGKAYFQVEDYIPASFIGRMTAPWVQLEVSEMHCLGPELWGEDAELEFLRVTQQLPEYGVLVHRVFPEKIRPEREMALGICAKGVIVYEVKNNIRIATLRFQWREIGKISTYRKKFTITSSITGKKHTFVTNSAKTGRYLLGLCSAQHGFNAQISSGLSSRVLTDYDKFVQMANLNSAQQGQAKPLSSIPRLSCSEKLLFVPKLDEATGDLLSTSLDDINMETSKEAGREGIRGSPSIGPEQLKSTCMILKPRSSDPVCGLPIHNGSQNNRIKTFAVDPDSELVCVTLRRDSCLGFGFVINGEDDAGKVDTGIFISSIIPGGPAEKTNKIKPGGQILALNHISLKGFTFNMAARMIQNSDNIELIISQSKGICENTPREEKNGTANPQIFTTESLSHEYQESFPFHTQHQDKIIEKLEMAQSQNLMAKLRTQLSPLPLKKINSSCPSSPSETKVSKIYFVELIKEDGTLGFSVTGGINTSVLHGGIYVKSIIPGGPAAKEGQIMRGDRLLQVDGLSLCGLTHKQAVQCLKGSGKVARLVLERRGPSTAQQCPSANASMGDGRATVSLVTTLSGRPTSCISVTDGHKFEVKLKKNASGLGFSFVQMERETCNHLKNNLVRIRRLFPGQPAEENGAIAAGDIILAVNGKPTEGLAFQEVLHLLRGASQEVTLLLCRPPSGALPEIDDGWQTPVFQELTRSTDTDLELSPSLDQEGNVREGASLDTGEGLCLMPESFQKTTREAHWDQETPLERPWVSYSTCPGDHPPLCKNQQEMDTSTLATSLEKEVRQNCYSVCDIRRLESPELDRDNEEGHVCHPLEPPSPAMVDEEYLPFDSTSASQLPCGACLEADSGTIPLPQFCCWGTLSEFLPPEESHESENKWEDLEESTDLEDGVPR